MPPCHGGDRGFDSRLVRHVRGPVAQLVEQRTENPCVAGSIPAWATIPKFCKKVSMKSAFFSFTKFYVRRHMNYQSLFSTNLQIYLHLFIFYCRYTVCKESHCGS